MAKSKKSTKKIGGPFLAAALFCESFIEDASGKVSVIGISDGCAFYIPHDAPKDVPSKEHPVMLSQNLLLIFRTGDSPGKHKVSLVIESPKGERKQALENDIELTKPLHGGCNVRTHASFAVFTGGVYWIDVYLDGKRVTRMPLNILFQRLPPPPQSSAGNIETKK